MRALSWLQKSEDGDGGGAQEAVDDAGGESRVVSARVWITCQ